jgi:uncharacterized protein (DUF1800 family)
MAVAGLMVSQAAVADTNEQVRAPKNGKYADVAWSEAHVRRVLRAFAYGGLADDAQVKAWARMRPEKATRQMLSFDVNNERLSPSRDASATHCGSLEALQNFWASDDPDNPMRYSERRWFQELTGSDRMSEAALQKTWTRAVSTRGCNPFLHKMGLYLTNYHASISIRNTRPALMRAYYDDYIASLSSGDNFVRVLTRGAQHAAVARAYRHQYNRYYNGRATFDGNEDFAREYLQLFFGIAGTTEDPEYYETVAIKNNALVLTGMDLDRMPEAYGSIRPADWWMAPIRFFDHSDDSNRNVRNKTMHYRSDLGEDSCIEVLHENICGKNARQKLNRLGPVAARHPESLDYVPVSIVQFFADDQLTPKKTRFIRQLWRDANFDLLAFIRTYAISPAFHSPSTVKYFTSFERNLLTQNASVLDNQEQFAKPSFYTPHDRMKAQGVEIFEPVRNVFGHQTGLDAVSDPYIFKNAFVQNTDNGRYHHVTSLNYTMEADGESQSFRKDWSRVIEPNRQGQFLVPEVAEYLWQRFIGDDGKNFDTIAKAQVYALLVTGQDFGYVVDPDNPDPEVFYGTADIQGGHARAAAVFQDLAGQELSFTINSTHRNIGMAVNFITMLPYAFAMEGR